MARRFGSKARNTPNPTGGIEAQLLHIRVLGTLQGIDAGPSELWSEDLQKFGMGE